MKRAILLCALLFAAPAFSAERQPLPDAMPAPQEKPETEPAPQAQPDVMPAPPEKPETEPTTQAQPDTMPAPPEKPDEPAKAGEDSPALTQPAPTPTPRPDAPPPAYAPALPPPGENPIAGTVPPDLRAPKGVLPVDEVACRAELKKIGVKFEDAEPEADAAGCSMPFPVTVSELGSGVKIEPPVTMNCAMALASARLTADTIQKTAKTTFNSPVKSITQASGYVCRPRNGTSKLSEHAFGNALDIAAFTLENGTVVTVQPSLPAPQQKFLTEIRNAACGPFKTVLGPGSNADHETHFHLDLANRRNGGTYCR